MIPVDAESEHDYVFSARFPERQAVYEAIAASSAAARRDCYALTDLAYGDHPRERLDLFPAAPDAPLLVFVHGGYWSSLDKSSFSYVAPPFLRRGFSVAIIGYPLAPATPLRAIVDSLTRSLRWLVGEGRTHLPAAQALYLSGHSAGGHLAALMAIGSGGRWGDGPRVPPVAGCAPLSGIFDLRPLLRTTIAGRVGLDAISAQTLSPLLQPAASAWLLAAVGEAETPGFIGQTRRYVQHCRALGGDASMLVLPAANHYTVLLELTTDDSRFLRAFHARVVQDRGTTP